MDMKHCDSTCKVLVLAPHPFLINRGTPIDAYLVVRALSERTDTLIDMVVYPEGEEISLPRTRVYRVPFFRWIKNIRPGFSLKKILLDVVMLFYALGKVHREKYSVVHAGEEAVFIAIFIKFLYGIPYIYDLDSSVAQQLVEKNEKLRLFAPLFNWFEAKAIQGAIANAPVCNALYELCERNGSLKTVTLHDISQLKESGIASAGLLRGEVSISNEILVLYCGNLEKYQGVDLLLESLPYALEKNTNIALAIIGGTPEDILFYTNKAKELSIEKSVHFLGPRPFDRLGEYLAGADILVAPRIKGINTPMKIFPYLHSGKPVLLTKLYTHTQIVTSDEAFLAEAVPEKFGRAIATLATDQKLREVLGQNGKVFVEKNHVYSAHKKRVDTLYDWVSKEIKLKNSLK